MSTVSDNNEVQRENSIASARPSSSSKGVIIFGVLVVFGIFIGLGIWSATAPLAKAVAAFATLSVKGERKQIQHFEGGIVNTLHVSEGQTVKSGDLLVSLDPLQASANVARHDKQLVQALAREARLESELKGERNITLMGQLLDRLSADPTVVGIVEAEERHLISKT